MAVIGDGRKISILSPMDLESRRRWYDYSRARDDTRARTDTSLAPWYLVNAYDKKLVGLNCIFPLPQPDSLQGDQARRNFTFQCGKSRTDVEPKTAATTKFLKCFDSRQVMEYSEERIAVPSG